MESVGEEQFTPRLGGSVSPPIELTTFTDVDATTPERDVPMTEEEEKQAADYFARTPEIDDTTDVAKPSTKRWWLAPLNFGLLTMNSIGVVFGDLGTSPIYTYPTVFNILGDFTSDMVYGIVSLMLWSIILIVCIKYLVIVMTFDNNGEGGILALCTLIPPTREDRDAGNRVSKSTTQRWVKRFGMFLGLLGAAFILGDGALTPAVEVLSAVEGLAVVNETVVDYEVLIGGFFLIILFVAQSFGSSKLGHFFGPIMILWQFSIGAIGLYNIIKYDGGIFRCFDPRWAYWFIVDNPKLAFESLGGICLALTGVEALYADMGHFGKWPIRVGWFCCVFPSIVCSYLGQAAYIIANPNDTDLPFFRSIPSKLLWPMIILAICATIIASQALISSVFSLLSQAMALKCCPTMRVQNTDKGFHGQVYITAANYILFAVTMGLVLFFQTSEALAYAFAIAMTGAIAVASLVLMLMVVSRWWWTFFFVIPIGSLFFLVEMLYFASNMVKFTHGGWVPILITAILVILFGSWSIAWYDITQQHHKAKAPKYNRYLTDWLAKDHGRQLKGTAIFVSTHGEKMPTALKAYCKLSTAVYERIILVRAKGYDVPYIKDDAHTYVQKIDETVYSITLRCGFYEKRVSLMHLLHDPAIQAQIPAKVTSQAVVVYLARETVHLEQKRNFVARLYLGVYNVLARMAVNPVTRYIKLPKFSRAEFITVLSLQKKFPGDNCVSRWLNHTKPKFVPVFAGVPDTTSGVTATASSELQAEENYAIYYEDENKDCKHDKDDKDDKDEKEKEFVIIDDGMGF